MCADEKWQPFVASGTSCVARPGSTVTVTVALNASSVLVAAGGAALLPLPEAAAAATCAVTAMRHCWSGDIRNGEGLAPPAPPARQGRLGPLGCQ